MSKTLLGFDGPLAAPRGSLVRRGAAVALRGASVVLARLSRRVHARRAPELEFYAEAGAPEGALYVDGELVGYVAGVTRL